MLHTSVVIGLPPATRRAQKVLHPAPKTGESGAIRRVQEPSGLLHLCVWSRGDTRVMGLHRLTREKTGRQSPADASRTGLRSRDRNKARDRAVKTTPVPIECCPARETDSGCFDGGTRVMLRDASGTRIPLMGRPSIGSCISHRGQQDFSTCPAFKASGWPWSEALLHPWASYL
jgi:hypothetical protein